MENGTESRYDIAALAKAVMSHNPKPGYGVTCIIRGLRYYNSLESMSEKAAKECAAVCEKAAALVPETERASLYKKEEMAS